MREITVKVPYASEKDAESLHAALDAQFGSSSIRYGVGVLDVTIHSDTATRQQLRAVALAAVRAAPPPFKREDSGKIFRRALVKQARGKALSDAERGELDRAEADYVPGS